MVGTVVTDIMEMWLVIVMVIMMMSAESCLVRMRLYHQYLSYISPDSDEAYLQNTTAKEPPLHPEQTCGKSQSLSPNRILGGHAVSYGQYPWTAILSISGPATDTLCSGSLVSQEHVLSAAHCVQEKGIQVRIVLGELDYMDRLESQEIMQFKARKIHLHPKFRRIEGKDNQAPKYDLAILLLDRPVLSSSMIIPICLPPLGLHLNRNTPGTVAGWGRIGQTSSSPASSILQAATVPILSRYECVHQHQPGSSMPSVDQLCAGVSGDKKGPCPGDSGGPLMVPQQGGNSWILVGVVSNGPQICGLTPVIYSSVSHSIDWISKVVGLPM